ncbi:hypothetical protein [Herbiconiux daphne]|uniref:Protein kinase domain-containing protein n=1 Tax=Herbiconiux daphne TaxID=2970914 RepID=A0ABT2H1G9_9MICO|nr:hypothetical protein [Herbiconiux daphne]MCS5733760.1 hypothetical protein [Herbiconiux daphne]
MSEKQDDEKQGEQQFVSRAAGIRVREADLGARALIGNGAATDVHRLETFTVPGHHGGLAFVRVRDGAADHWDSAVLSRLVALRWQLDAPARTTLDGLAAWPLAVVEGDDGEIVGCLVPLAAHPFYYLPAEQKSQTKVPQQVKWLVIAPKRARRAGAVTVGERDLVARGTVLARVCLLLELLHRQGVVYGDLSDRSVLFGQDDIAEAFVVGCEGAAFAGEQTPQRNSAGWAAPESFEVPVESSFESGDASSAAGGDAQTDAAASRAPSVQTVATDHYKLALLILRVLAPAGDGLERSRDADRIGSVLDEVGQRMMHDALGDDPEARPTAAEWYAYLRGMIVENLEAPVIRRLEVTPALVAEGDEVRLEVELTGARRLTIEMPGRADITRDVGSRVVLERFTARQTGRVGVRASNEHGEVVALSNPVRVLPVPAPAQLPVVTPQVPEGLRVLPDLASLEAALGISTPPRSGAAEGASTGAAAGDDAASDSAFGSPFDRVAALRDRLDADALPLHDVLRIGVEAERVSREQIFPSFEEFLDGVTDPKRRR